MKLFTIILLIQCINLFGDKMGARITKKQLRGARKEYLEGLIRESFVKTFDSLYDKIIECAKSGETEYQFTIMCKELPNNNCEIENGHQAWARVHSDSIVVYAKPYIIIEQYTTNVIQALKQTFIDSNITKINKNCCDYYSIQW
jgi:hypothetical protein